MFDLSRRRFLAAAAATTGVSYGSRNSCAGPRNEKIKIGQIGTGHAHASSVFTALRRVTDDFEVVGVVENDPRRRQALGDNFQDVKLISEEQFFNTPGVQAAVVETEVQDLLPTARRCIDAGLHIHLDKPAGENLIDFKNLLDEVGRRNLHIQMGCIYRYHSAFQFCYRAVEEGWLGDLFELHAVMSKKINQTSRNFLSRFAGGSMFEIGCHVIDAMVRLMGRPHKTTPYARQTHSDQDPLVDNQLAVFDYPRAIASVRSSLVEVEGFQRRQFTVCGENGTFDLRPLGGETFRLALEQPRDSYHAGYQEVTVPAGPGIFDRAFQDMAAVIRDEKGNDYPLDHELAVHETVLRASGYDVD